ncbi:hypothetical protein FK519_26645 [Klebsiella pneumoniae]|nr:hypothetical protein [Klebsiella pneumoniae]
MSQRKLFRKAQKRDVRVLLALLARSLRSRHFSCPTVLRNQLAKDLESWEPPSEEGKVLQYVDDLLIATRTKESCVIWTVSLLNFLGLQGYRVSKKKAQALLQPQVTYLGYEISAGQRILGQARKEAICQSPRPQTIKELRTFLGMTGGANFGYVIMVCLLSHSIP